MGPGSQALCVGAGQPWTPVSLALPQRTLTWDPGGLSPLLVTSPCDLGQITPLSGLRGIFPHLKRLTWG